MLPVDDVVLLQFGLQALRILLFFASISIKQLKMSKFHDFQPEWKLDHHLFVELEPSSLYLDRNLQLPNQNCSNYSFLKLKIQIFEVSNSKWKDLKQYEEIQWLYIQLGIHGPIGPIKFLKISDRMVRGSLHTVVVNEGRHIIK